MHRLLPAIEGKQSSNNWTSVTRGGWQVDLAWFRQRILEHHVGDGAHGGLDGCGLEHECSALKARISRSLGTTLSGWLCCLDRNTYV